MILNSNASKSKNIFCFRHFFSQKSKTQKKEKKMTKKRKRITRKLTKPEKRGIFPSFFLSFSLFLSSVLFSFFLFFVFSFEIFLCQKISIFFSTEIQPKSPKNLQQNIQNNWKKTTKKRTKTKDLKIRTFLGRTQNYQFIRSINMKTSNFSSMIFPQIKCYI